MTNEELDVLIVSLKDCLETTAFNSGLASNIEIKSSRLEILKSEVSDLDNQMTSLNDIRLKKIEEIERLENSINELRAQLLYDDT
jgi:HAMP domain-containing protein